MAYLRAGFAAGGRGFGPAGSLMTVPMQLRVTSGSLAGEIRSRIAKAVKS
jgi:hypothetical protein